jgi:hypothetical protein
MKELNFRLETEFVIHLFINVAVKEITVIILSPAA